MQPTKKKGFVVLEGIVIGGSLGLLAGTLFAPRSGKEIRSGMKQRAEKTIGEVKEICSNTEIKAKTLLEDAKRRADDLRRETIHQFAGTWDRARNVLCGCGKVKQESLRAEAEITAALSD